MENFLFYAAWAVAGLGLAFVFTIAILEIEQWWKQRNKKMELKKHSLKKLEMNNFEFLFVKLVHCFFRSVFYQIYNGAYRLFNASFTDFSSFLLKF
jgi:Na+-driven multidrug efflux pump